MIVHQIHIEGLSIFKLENDPVIAGYEDAEPPLVVAGQAVQAKASDIELLDSSRGIQYRQVEIRFPGNVRA
jgi:hypothetical protein